MSMKRFLVVFGLMLSVGAATASAGASIPAVPEMDAGLMTTAMTALSGGVLLVMGRRRRAK